jgi:glycogen operon protein
MGIKDVMWFNPGGDEMNDEEWNSGLSGSLAVLWSGQTEDVRDMQGRPIKDGTFVLFFNAHHEPVTFVLPRIRSSRAGWELIINTEEEVGFVEPGVQIPARGQYTVTGRALAVLRHGKALRKGKSDGPK